MTAPGEVIGYSRFSALVANPHASRPITAVVGTDGKRCYDEADRRVSWGIADLDQLQQVVRRTVEWVNDRYRRLPMIVPSVVEV